MRGAHLTAVAAGLVLLASSAGAVTRHVPSEYPTIQAGLDASASGDVVLVAPGTYTDSEFRTHEGPLDVYACAFIPSGVTLRSEAGPEVTTIDLQRHGYVIVIRFPPPGQATVEGFTVTSQVLGTKGVNSNNPTTFRNCIFRDLRDDSNWGVGIYSRDNLLLERCQFLNIICGSAGAAVNHHDGRLEMYECIFRDCGKRAVWSTGEPGGVVESSYVERCTFENCWDTGTGASALALTSHAGSTVRDCRFIGNTTGPQGEAMFVNGYPPTSKVVEGCLFWNNSGGRALGTNGPTIVRGNTFYGHATAYPGVAVTFGGPWPFLTSELLNNVIVECISWQGAVHVYDDIPLISGCNVFWQNHPGNNYTPAATDRIVDPLFCHPATGDFKLMVGSPCLPPGSVGCGLIGAFGEGDCGVISVEPTSWGHVKAAYRGASGVAR